MNEASFSDEQAHASEATTRVLVVEDDPVVRRLLQQSLHRSGLAVAAVDSGEEALALARYKPTVFHLVVTDGIMPGIDGFELARFFERESPETAVILVSGFLHHFISQPDIPSNIQAFFDKPFVLSEIVAKAFELLKVPA